MYAQVCQTDIAVRIIVSKKFFKQMCQTKVAVKQVCETNVAVKQVCKTKVAIRQVSETCAQTFCMKKEW